MENVHMNGKQKKVFYPSNIIAEAVNRYVNGGQNVKKIADDLGVTHYTTIYGWIKKSGHKLKGKKRGPRTTEAVISLLPDYRSRTDLQAEVIRLTTLCTKLMKAVSPEVLIKLVMEA